MTYRERKERRAERRAEWARKRKAKSEAAFDSAKNLADQVPLGQPILVGHHSEGHARRDAGRITSNMAKGVEHEKMASRHTAVAGGIDRQLETSIYRDDVDELERLEEKLAGLESRRDRIKQINGWIAKNRKRYGFATRSLDWRTTSEAEILRATQLFAECAIALSLTPPEAGNLAEAVAFSRSVGLPPYALANLSNAIKRTSDRLPAARERAEQREKVRRALQSEENEASAPRKKLQRP